jgi:hypothetical protein
MMKFKMKSLALALGTVLGGVSLIPAVQAVQLATDDLGQALIIPYYTTRAGWSTLFNVTNTSDQYLAIKVRFHEGHNSRDVFDFNVVMSPYDVWNGFVQNGPGNIPVFATRDTSCTVPQIPAAGQPFQGNGANGILAYTNQPGGIQAADGGPTTTDRMREGYVTILLMGSASLVAGAAHANGVPTNCQSVRDLFSNPTGISALRAAFPDYVANPLKGTFSLVNSSMGQTAAGKMVTLADFFRLDATPTGNGPSLVTLQRPVNGAGGTGDFMTSYLEPDLHSSNTPAFVLQDGGAGASTAQVLTTADTGPDQVLGGADAVSFVLARTNVINQWALNTDATNGWITASDWVVTFPTKRFYTDQSPILYAGRANGADVGLASGRAFTNPGLATPGPNLGVNRGRWAGLTGGGLPLVAQPANPFASLFTTSANVGNGSSCDPVSYSIWDREEYRLQSSTGPVFSPSPSTPGNAICTEVNVLSFGPSLGASRVLGSPIVTGGLVANVLDLPGPNGWMNLSLAAATNANYGLPVVGFSITSRATGNGSMNEAFLVDHAYTRATPPPSVIQTVPVP